ncbi:MAG TPA: peptidoglycan recognition family protein [Candidatus Sumerlaeota bacterium]|nr:peptidoglycan recognition family protein [Candidatus Sumerlaeota bacterium]
MGLLRTAFGLALLMIVGTILTGCGHSGPPAPKMNWVEAGSYRKDNRKRGDIVAIVIHTTEANYMDDLSFVDNHNRTFAGSVKYFVSNDRSVSAHYVMGPNGEITNMVKVRDVAHTQTYYNGRAIGIECAGWGRFPEMWTPQMMDSLVNLCAYLCAKYDIPPYQPEGTAYEGPYAIVIGDPAIGEDGKAKRGPNTDRYSAHGLVGHYQVQPWNKSDPGPHFPWAVFTARVRQRMTDYGAKLVPLPGPEDTAKEVYATATIKEDAATAGKPFTYQLSIVGKGAGAINASDITFPNFAKVKDLVAGEPTKTGDASENRATFEVPLTMPRAASFALTASRINFNGTWTDSPTLDVKVEQPIP